MNISYWFDELLNVTRVNIRNLYLALYSQPPGDPIDLDLCHTVSSRHVYI